MLIPIRHENMSARRWPIITLALIAINTVVFLSTHDDLVKQSPELGKVKAHIVLLAAMHPELSLTPESQQLVKNFREQNPAEWTKLQDSSHQLLDGWDARMRLMEDPADLQAEMDSLNSQYAKLSTSSIAEQYAFVPANPKPIAYLTANFLHGSWMHLIGNMWFLWLAGFVLEDAWGRILYGIVYFTAGAAALQFHAWTNPASIIPTLGASGAVAALMGAFLVRFPNMRIEMMWLFMFRSYRFKAPAYALLPLWLAMEVFYGTLLGHSSGVAHWAHVGGFLFGAVAALALRYSGLEKKANQAIEDQVAWTNDPEIVQASELVGQGQFDDAVQMLNNYLAKNPESTDAWSLLRDVQWRKGDIAANLETTAKLCALHIKAREPEAAWDDYEELLKSGGNQLPAACWLELCRIPEERQDFERALSEYQKLAAAYPSERQSLMAQLAAARICLHRLNRPLDALKFYEAAACSSVPHLDMEQNILAGIREAKAAVPAEELAALPLPVGDSLLTR